MKTDKVKERRVMYLICSNLSRTGSHISRRLTRVFSYHQLRAGVRNLRSVVPRPQRLMVVTYSGGDGETHELAFDFSRCRAGRCGIG